MQDLTTMVASGYIETVPRGQVASKPKLGSNLITMGTAQLGQPLLNVRVGLVKVFRLGADIKCMAAGLASGAVEALLIAKLALKGQVKLGLLALGTGHPIQLPLYLCQWIHISTLH